MATTASNHPRFIEDRALSLLSEVVDPRPFLKPGFFCVRRGESPPTSGHAAQTGLPWAPIEGKVLAADRRPDGHLSRVVLVAKAGMGVTKFLEWWNARINTPGSMTLSFLLDVAELPGNPGDFIRETLVGQVLEAERNGPELLPQDRAEQLLDRLRLQGRLVLLFDGLDRLRDPGSATLKTLRSVISSSWAQCTIVLGARRGTVERLWNSLFDDDSARPWRFAKLEGFDDRQRGEYLGDGLYDSLPADVRPLFTVPRLLARWRSLTDLLRAQHRTSGEVYLWVNEVMLGEGGVAHGPCTVPSLPPHFLPRPEVLDTILDRLLGGEDQMVALTAGVQGMGGIGKTVMARAAGQDWEVRAAFPDGIFWFTLGQTPSLPSLLDELIQFLALPAPQTGQFKQTTEALIAFYTGWLHAELSKSENTKACLVILDNVWDPRHDKAFGGKLRRLVTTRDASIIEKRGIVSLDVLSEDQSLRLLAAWSKWEGELPPAARVVAGKLEHLPVLLAPIGALARGAEAGRWDDLLGKLGQKGKDWITTEALKGFYHELPTVVQALWISIDDMKKQDRDRYLELAVFPADTRIPTRTLQIYWGEQGFDKVDVDWTINTLVDRALVLRDPEGRITLHDLYHDYLRKQASDLTELNHRLLKANQECCPNGWASMAKDDGYFFQYLPHHLHAAGRLGELRPALLDYR